MTGPVGSLGMSRPAVGMSVCVYVCRISTCVWWLLVIRVTAQSTKRRRRRGGENGSESDGKREKEREEMSSCVWCVCVCARECVCAAAAAQKGMLGGMEPAVDCGSFPVQLRIPCTYAMRLYGVHCMYRDPSPSRHMYCVLPSVHIRLSVFSRWTPWMGQEREK